MKKAVIFFTLLYLTSQKILAQETNKSTRSQITINKDTEAKADPDPNFSTKLRTGVNDNKPLPKGIRFENVARHIGELVQFTAKIYSYKDTSDFILLNLGPYYPASEGIAILKGAAKRKIKDIINKSVLIEGRVSKLRKTPVVVIDDPENITVLW